MGRIKISPSTLIALPSFRKTMLGSILPADVVTKLYAKFGRPKTVTHNTDRRDDKGHFLPKIKKVQY